MEKQYKSLIIKQRSPDSSVFYIYLNNPSRGNALSPDFSTEFPDAVASLDQNPDVAVIILTGAGKHFCSGIELETLNSNTGSSESTGPGHAAEKLRREIKVMQRAVNAIEECRKPVIALIHGACIGGGVDIASACDIRYCMESTFFSVKEVDMALAADLGSLQRLPRIVGFGNAMELALTGRRFTALEAKELGLVTRVFGTKQDVDQGVESIAEGEELDLRTNHFQEGENDMILETSHKAWKPWRVKWFKEVLKEGSGSSMFVCGSSMINLGRARNIWSSFVDMKDLGRALLSMKVWVEQGAPQRLDLLALASHAARNAKTACQVLRPQVDFLRPLQRIIS